MKRKEPVRQIVWETLETLWWLTILVLTVILTTMIAHYLGFQTDGWPGIR